jgi:hypothetical protein
MRTLTLKVTVVCVGFIVLGLLCVSPGHTKIEPNDIVGIWLFDEGKGDVAKDSSDNGNDGKVLGKLKWETGKFGNALLFPGVDGQNFVEVPDPKGRDLPDGFTISMWVKIQSRGENQRLFSNEGGGNRNIVFEVNFGAGDIARIVYTVGGVCCNWADANPNEKITDDQWHHVVGVFGKPKLLTFTDGKVGQDKCMGNPGNCALSADLAIGPFVIGSRPAATGILNGLMDDVGLFNRALTEAEILEIRDKGLAQALDVSPKGKAATVWGRIKAGHKSKTDL